MLCTYMLCESIYEHRNIPLRWDIFVYLEALWQKKIEKERTIRIYISIQ